MTKPRRKLINYQDLSEDCKDKILEEIRVKEISILNASLEFNVTARTINKIFSERFGKRERKSIETLIEQS
mgnify:CR=1 FL=1